jgi:hypothetical protein
MANTITISVTSQDLAELQANPSISPSKLFRSAMRLERAMQEFSDIYDIWDFCLHLRGTQDKFITLGKEIQRRQERIDSLQDVLAQKELTERRLRKADEANNGIVGTIAEIERLA